MKRPQSSVSITKYTRLRPGCPFCQRSASLFSLSALLEVFFAEEGTASLPACFLWTSSGASSGFTTMMRVKPLPPVLLFRHLLSRHRPPIRSGPPHGSEGGYQKPAAGPVETVVRSSVPLQSLVFGRCKYATPFFKNALAARYERGKSWTMGRVTLHAAFPLV